MKIGTCVWSAKVFEEQLVGTGNKNVKSRVGSHAQHDAPTQGSSRSGGI